MPGHLKTVKTPPTLPYVPETTIPTGSSPKSTEVVKWKALLDNLFTSSADNIESFLNKEKTIPGNPLLGTILYDCHIQSPITKQALIVKKIPAITLSKNSKNNTGPLRRQSIHPPTADNMKKSARFNYLFGLSPIENHYCYNNHYYLIMYKIDGAQLQDYLNNLSTKQHMPIKKAFRIIKSILENVKNAHTLCITHVDIKPENFILLRSDEVKLVDFDTAFRLKPDTIVEKTNQLLGTLAFLAPECTAKTIYGYPSDIFATAKTIKSILAKTNFTSSRIDAQVKRQLEAMVCRMLSPKLRQRKSNIRDYLNTFKDIERMVSVREKRSRSSTGVEKKQLAPLFSKTHKLCSPQAFYDKENQPPAPVSQDSVLSKTSPLTSFFKAGCKPLEESNHYPRKRNWAELPGVTD